MASGLILPPAPPEVLTCDDIIRAGACTGGVAKRLHRVSRGMQIAAAEPPARLMTIVPQDEHQHIQAAVNQSPNTGSATCYGYGDGHGYGYGDGDGFGDGFGDGDGYGDGYGDGDGDGGGDGGGGGYGYGDGDGDGGGYGYGDGYGSSPEGKGSYA
jgi:hypothetical protein